MKARSLLPILIFAGVQCIGLICMLTWNLSASGIRSIIWGIGLVALIPGNFLAAMTVQRLFWQANLSNTSLSAIQALLAVAINAIVWFIAFRAIRALLSERNRSNVSRSL